MHLGEMDRLGTGIVKCDKCRDSNVMEFNHLTEGSEFVALKQNPL